MALCKPLAVEFGPWLITEPCAKGVVEDVVPHLVPLFDAGVGIKLPMHAHKNPALCIVEFCFAK